MLDCVVFKGFLDDLKKNIPIELFQISFGKSTIPISSFTSRDYLRDSNKTTVRQPEVIIDNGWTITVKFSYLEIRNFTKVYLLYSINNQYKVAYAFSALDFKTYSNIIKIDLSDFECNAPLNTNHRILNIIYDHRHEDSNAPEEINKTPIQKDLLTTISNMPSLTTESASYVSINNFGITNKESQIVIDQGFADGLKVNKKELGVNYISNHLIEFSIDDNIGNSIDNVFALTIDGSDFKCSVFKYPLNEILKDVGISVGYLKFFPSIDSFANANNLTLDNINNGPYIYAPCTGKVLDPDEYPEYFNIIGNKFGNGVIEGSEKIGIKTPDLINGYVRSSGYMDDFTKEGYSTFSQNPPKIRNHTHSYQKTYGHIRRQHDSGGQAACCDLNETLSTINGSDVLAAKSFIGIWGIKVK